MKKNKTNKKLSKRVRSSLPAVPGVTPDITKVQEGLTKNQQENGIMIKGTDDAIYIFEGPYTSTSYLEDKAGVYAVHCFRNGQYYLIDAGETSAIKSKLENLDHADYWAADRKGILTYSVLYTYDLPLYGRTYIEQDIKSGNDITTNLIS